MSSEAIGGICIVGLLILMYFRMWVGFAMLFVGFWGIVAILGWKVGMSVLATVPYRNVASYPLTAMPLFVMIGRVPVGDFIWEPLGDIADWIMQYPNGAAKRAIMIGVGLGMAATSLTLMLGIERAYLGKG